MSTPIYNIVFRGGSGGHLITNMILMMMEPRKYPLEISPLGDCHSGVERYWRRLGYVPRSGNYRDLPHQPWVVFEDVNCDLQSVIISHRTQDRAALEFCHYIKNYRVLGSTPQGADWQRVHSVHQTLVNQGQIDSEFTKLTVSEVHCLTSALIKDPGPPPTTDSDYGLIIAYADLFNEPDQVIASLERLTNLRATDTLRQLYLLWIHRNRQLFNAWGFQVPEPTTARCAPR